MMTDNGIDYEVSVTVTFSKRVPFAPPYERDITTDDALSAFYGYGLSDVLDSGEYGYSVDSGSIEVTRVS